MSVVFGSTDILLRCTACDQDVSVPTAVVELHLFLASDGLPAGYRFPCPACGAEPIEPATPRFAGVLTLADVVVTVGDRAPWQSPAPDRRD